MGEHGEPLVLRPGAIFDHTARTVIGTRKAMQKITSADQRELASVVKGLYCLDSVQLILEQVAESLPMLIWAETVFVATADPKRSRIALLAENVGPELYKSWPTLIALRHRKRRH